MKLYVDNMNKNVENLTDREEEVYNFIIKYTDRYGYSPTLREIGEALYISGTNAVHRYILSLKEKGYISYVPKKSRTLVILNRPKI